jgi:hypothetical protein
VRVFAIDPGYLKSAAVLYDGAHILSHDKTDNDKLLGAIPLVEADVLVIEEMQLFRSNFGVGKEIFDSAFWSGRFAQAWTPRRFDRLLRAKVRGHLGVNKGGDSAVRAALIDRFGPYKDQAIGKRSTPGPLFGVTADRWSALALAVTWHDLHGKDSTP